MAAAALRTAARHLAAPAALCGALASPPQRPSCNEHDERLANLKAEVALLRGENARLRRALDGDSLDVEALRLRIADFARERDWDQFHTPRNVLLAMVGEVGELSELFQWRGDAGCGVDLPSWSDADKTHLGEEMADVLLYLVRLADRCGVDLPAVAKAKLEKNKAKYPADKCRGSAAKYTAYA